MRLRYIHGLLCTEGFPEERVNLVRIANAQNTLIKAQRGFKFKFWLVASLHPASSEGSGESEPLLLADMYENLMRWSIYFMHKHDL